MKFRVGASVQWKWLGRPVKGTVREVYIHPTQKVIKGKTIRRNGSEENPAYLVLSEAGNFALKLHSELVPLQKSSRERVPQIFSKAHPHES